MVSFASWGRFACMTILTACGGGAVVPDAGGGTPDAAGGADAGLTVGVFGIVTAYKLSTGDGGAPVAWTDPGVVSGMQVCLRGSSIPCVTTGADGSYRLDGVPANAPIALVFEHRDFGGRQIIQRVTGLIDYRESPPLVTTESFNRYLSGSGCASPPSPGTGNLYIGAPPGASVVVGSPRPVVYMGDRGFDPSLTRISPQARPELAAAVVCGLAPGTYDLDFQSTTGSCHMAEGWPTAGHDIRVVVDRDSFTLTNWFCQ